MTFGVTVIESVVAPVLHEYWVPPEAAKVALSPWQMLKSGPRSKLGNGFAVTAMVSDAVQLFAAVSVTLKVVSCAGLTVMEEVVAPVLHEKEPVPDAVMVRFEPAQVAVSFPSDKSGDGLTVTVAESVPEQPVESDAVTL